MLLDESVRFTLDEVGQLLSMPRKALDVLVATGALHPDKQKRVGARDVETFCGSALMRLYQAAAERQIEISIDVEPAPAAPPVDVPLAPKTDDELIVTRSLAEFQAEAHRERADLRATPRFLPRRPLNGKFRDVPFTVLQLSASGMRIRHEETLRPGDEAVVNFASQKPPRAFSFRASVVWTSIAQRGDAPSYCISGLRALEKGEGLRQAAAILLVNRELVPAEESASVRGTERSPSALTGLSDDDVASIIRAIRRFSSDPVEASRWYNRARFAVTDAAVREAAPTRARDREEVLGIWEYLDRRIDIRAITGVVTWVRQARSAGAADV